MAKSTGRLRNEETRLAILDATRSELASRGWDTLSFERIAAVAGVGKQTLYRWWPTKAALVSEMVTAGGILPVGPVAVSDDVHADVTAWMLAVARVYDDPDAAAVLQAIIAAVAEDADLSANYDERITTAARTRLAERLRLAVEAGALPPDLRIDTVTQVFLAMVLWCLVTRRPLDGTLVEDLVAATLPVPPDGYALT
ncbi:MULTISPECIES: TetR/AcrR family transcriptional regulator [unclassified Curtobacterium]|uniref:TetR/AcrR family transcriptional regulator n=1 Tax=unclassified Curtobacterium TaxID=257496 RepID=UPI000DA8BF3F|nr:MULTISPECIES: TetR/AcrR family transcriptional regulator [unclassified Curtobacterium]PZE23445.1 TetR family transcriptional regulator [Curtobacterium sp. MCBD17_028]PZE77847.1 TetR family transcriptional regulator [Curtobacterium sp. MCBD17_019]PZF55355.1 TetR family transcriptional regulator [Curtobacterium sp. MCBD17_034]PZF61540.1 TetR family transcriptional regulator [Curtobacterium sp. MCBD17_013]PZM32821.1 TetR family transcriptional regulator [Curtobacterium sp. MCBD17_031]